MKEDSPAGRPDARYDIHHTPSQETLKTQIEWLTGRVESPPTSYQSDRPEVAGLRSRMAWSKLKRLATEGDEIWAFTSPGGTWKPGRQSGYALVRDGAILDSVLVSG